MIGKFIKILIVLVIVYGVTLYMGYLPESHTDWLKEQYQSFKMKLADVAGEDSLLGKFSGGALQAIEKLENVTTEQILEGSAKEQEVSSADECGNDMFRALANLKKEESEQEECNYKGIAKQIKDLQDQMNERGEEMTDMY